MAVLTEIEPNKKYEIDYIPKPDVYFSLLTRIPFLLREPREIEDTFFSKRMTEAEQQTFEEKDLSNKDVIAIETYTRPQVIEEENGNVSYILLKEKISFK